MKHKKVIGVFTLAMINVAAIDSIRNLPIIAEYGVSLIFFLLMAAIGFLLPTSLVSAELASGWSKEGGIYTWVKAAFGKDAGFLASWLQWSHNLPWYPAVLSFIAVTLAFAFFPDLADDKLYLLPIVFSVLWIFTYINSKGIEASSKISEFCVIVGTIVPSILLIGMAIFWVVTGEQMQIDFVRDDFLPKFELGHLVFFSGMILGFAGIEMSASHIMDVKNPQKNYPRAILLSSFIILLIMILGSLAIAIVVPNHRLDIVGGIVQAFEAFLTPFGLGWMVPIISIFVVVGSIGMVSTWIVGPVRSLHVVAIKNDLPDWFQKLNKNNMPINLLIMQAVIASLTSVAFVLMPNVSSAFWVLSVLAAQLYVLMYMMMFVSAIKLRYSHAHIERMYRIPFGNVGMWVVSLVGISCCLFVFFIGFLPPNHLETGHIFLYVAFLVIGNLLLIFPPWIIKYFKK